MTLPMALKQLRTELQLQQKELAELLHVNAVTINRWETGKTRPSRAIGMLLLHTAKEKGASEVCISSLDDVLNPKSEIVEKTNDLRYTEIDSINRLVNEAPNGVIVIGLKDRDILYMNDNMIALTGISMEKAAAMKCYQLITQSDSVCDSCRKLDKGFEKSTQDSCPSAQYGNFRGRYFAIHTKQTYWKGQRALIKYFTDITELHELQQQVAQQKKALNYATQFAGMQVFQYEIPENTASLMTDIPSGSMLPKTLKNFDRAALHDKVILPEYAEAYKQMLWDIRSGKQQAEAEVHTKEPDGTSNWLHFQMNITATDKTGKPLTAIGSVRVINREKSMQDRIRFEHEKIINGQNNLVAYVVSNLTKNKIIECHFMDKSSAVPPSAGDCYDSRQIEASRWMLGTENQERHAGMHRRAFLSDSFAKGTASFAEDYRVKRGDGFVVWIRNALYLYQDISTGDIYLYEYYQSIDERRFFERFLQETKQRDDCDFGILYLQSGQLNKFTFLETEKQSRMSIVDYTTEIQQLCERYVLPQDRDHFIECTSLHALSQKLRDKTVYQYSYRFVTPKGRIGKKIGRVIWLNHDDQICLISSMTTGTEEVYDNT